MKLSKRLTQIESMVTEPYQHIWDCCCDHGLLGAALLSRSAAPYIHFVDRVPELMHTLESRLNQFHPKNAVPKSQWQLHCIDVSALPLQEFNGKHLIIIAGVGGDLMGEFINAIYEKNPGLTIDFLLCPIHHQFTLRQQLIQHDFSLKTESLLIDNQRFYEILLVSTNHHPHKKLHPTGSDIWQSDCAEQAKTVAGYLQKTIAHYQRMQLNQHTDVKHILIAYKAVNLANNNFADSTPSSQKSHYKINTSKKGNPINATNVDITTIAATSSGWRS